MSRRDKLGIVTNIVVLLLVGYALGRPEGPVGAVIGKWWRSAARDRVLAREWQRVALAPRLDTSSVQTMLVEFSDYECPFCREQHRSMSEAIERKGVAGVAFRQLPLAIHARARGAALAAICAEQSGKFRELHNRLFSRAEWMVDTNWVREARAVGIVDTVRFARCLLSTTAREQLERDILLARELGLRGTPSFVTTAGAIEGVVAETTLVRLTARR